MAANDNGNEARPAPWRTTGFASRHEDLRTGTPATLRAANAPREPFDQARDPLIARQMAEMGQSEAERREGGGRGSQMVKRHKPRPELRPRAAQAQGPMRETFNRAWLKEHRAARLASLKAQRASGQERGSEGRQRRYGPQR